MYIKLLLLFFFFLTSLASSMAVGTADLILLPLPCLYKLVLFYLGGGHCNHHKPRVWLVQNLLYHHVRCQVFYFYFIISQQVSSPISPWFFFFFFFFFFFPKLTNRDSWGLIHWGYFCKPFFPTSDRRSSKQTKKTELKNNNNKIK